MWIFAKQPVKKRHICHCNRIVCAFWIYSNTVHNT